MKRTLVVLCLFLFCLGCRYFAVRFTPGKSASDAPGTLSQTANICFWEQLHLGNYDSIPVVINLLTAAYLADPGDVNTLSHLGFAHFWAFAEARRRPPSPLVLNDVLLARRYFAEAYALNPTDARILGFLADAKMVEGTLSNDQRLVTDGYFDGLHAIRMWKQFNKFAIGYALSLSDTGSKQFTQGLRWQWETLADCSCREYAGKEPDFTAIARWVKESTDEKISRACWNSWIAPHNWEGFFMNFGDMLVKSGKPQQAIAFYNAARLSDSFEQWPFKAELDKRIAAAEANVAAFNKPVNRDDPGQELILVSSKLSCVVCHQAGKEELHRTPQ